MAGYQYAYTTFNFKLEVNGLTLGHFQTVTGLSHEMEVLTHQEGGVNDRQHKLPGQGSYPNISLKMGYIASELAEDWHFNYQATPSSVGRKDGSIIMLNDAGEEVTRWNFVRAWPVKWVGPEFNSGSDEMAVETIEIAHEGLIREGARRPSPSSTMAVGTPRFIQDGGGSPFGGGGGGGGAGPFGGGPGGPLGSKMAGLPAAPGAPGAGGLPGGAAAALGGTKLPAAPAGLEKAKAAASKVKAKVAEAKAKVAEGKAKVAGAKAKAEAAKAKAMSKMPG